MINFFKKLFGSKPEATQPEAAPYKVETTSVVEQATQAVVESIAPVVEKPVKAKKAPAPKKPRAPKAAKKPKTTK